LWTPNDSIALLGEFSELVVGDLFQRRRDDLDIRRKRGLNQIGQAGHQLALGQIARRSEQDDDVGDVIADVKTAPEWSSQHQGAEILDTYDDGRPKRVRIRLKTVGITDVQVLDYTWTDLGVSWELVSSGQLRNHAASYTLTPDAAGTKVRFDISIDPSMPVPGFILKRAMRGGLEAATDGLREQVVKLKRECPR
jgi:hypothetical protein